MIMAIGTDSWAHLVSDTIGFDEFNWTYIFFTKGKKLDLESEHKKLPRIFLAQEFN